MCVYIYIYIYVCIFNDLGAWPRIASFMASSFFKRWRDTDTCRCVLHVANLFKQYARAPLPSTAGVLIVTCLRPRNTLLLGCRDGTIVCEDEGSSGDWYKSHTRICDDEGRPISVWCMAHETTANLMFLGCYDSYIRIIPAFPPREVLEDKRVPSGGPLLSMAVEDHILAVGSVDYAIHMYVADEGLDYLTCIDLRPTRLIFAQPAIQFAEVWCLSYLSRRSPASRIVCGTGRGSLYEVEETFDAKGWHIGWKPNKTITMRQGASIFALSYNEARENLALALEDNCVQIHCTISWDCILRYVFNGDPSHGPESHDNWAVCLHPSQHVVLVASSRVFVLGEGGLELEPPGMQVYGQVTDATYSEHSEKFFLTTTSGHLCVLKRDSNECEACISITNGHHEQGDESGILRKDVYGILGITA